MNIYRREVMVCATVYVKASSADAAERKMRGIEFSGFVVTGWRGDVSISGAKFDSPDMPKVSLSPAMTIHGPWPRSKMENVG